MTISYSKPSAVFARRPGRPKRDAGAFTILVADDNETNVKVLQYYLAKFDCAVIVARDGGEAVRAFRTHKIDAILMDIQMPDLDGFEATREIRKIERGEGAQTVPIVAVTAHVKPADQHLCIDAGMNDYLQKPVHFATLCDALRVWAPALSRRATPRATEGIAAGG